MLQADQTGVLNGDGGEPGDRREKLQVILRKSCVANCRVEVDDAAGATGDAKWHAENRMRRWRARFDLATFVIHDGDAFFNHAMDQGAADVDRMIGAGDAIPCDGRGDLHCFLVHQEDCAALRRYDIENHPD